MPRRSRSSLATVRRFALALPGVEEGHSYGTPGFRVRGKFLARLREVLEQAWRLHAPRRLVAEYDRQRGG